MANCFDAHIGLKGCSTVIPTSGLYVNSLPGISTELVDKIATADQVSYRGVWKDILAISKTQLLNDLVNGLSEQINFHQIVYQTKRPRPSRTKETIPAFAEYRGVFIQAPESRYSQIRIKNLFVYSAALIDALVTVKTWNVWDGSEINSQDITLSPGFNEIALNLDIDLKFSENTVFIGVDSSILDTIYFLQEAPDYWNFWDDECPYYQGQLWSNQLLLIQPASMSVADTPDYSTVVRQGRPAGVWVQAEVICSSELFLCENITAFTTAILYLLGHNLLLYKIASPRQNFFTYWKESITEQLLVDYKQKYKSNLKRSLAAVPKDGAGFCFDCENTRTYEYHASLP